MKYLLLFLFTVLAVRAETYLFVDNKHQTLGCVVLVSGSRAQSTGNVFLSIYRHVQPYEQREFIIPSLENATLRVYDLNTFALESTFTGLDIGEGRSVHVSRVNNTANTAVVTFENRKEGYTSDELFLCAFFAFAIICVLSLGFFSGRRS